MVCFMLRNALIYTFKMKTEQDLIGYLDKLNKLCRVCLCENNVKSEPLNPYWESLYEKVMSCMQIDFLTKDMLPCEICDLCCKELEVADKLRLKCENSNAVLKRVYQQYLVKDEQKQSNPIEQTPLLDDHLETYESVDEMEGNNHDCWDVPLEDNKDEIKDVILQINLERSVLGESKKKKSKKKKAGLKNGRKETDCDSNEVVIKSENSSGGNNYVKESKNAIDQNLFSCDICNKQLKCRQTIIHHIKKQHNSEKMKEPLLKVTGYGSERRFHCHECPYKSKSKTAVKVHIRVHTGVKPHVCDICSRSFSQHASLINHKLTHSDSRCFTCQECGKQFKDLKTVNRHQRVHSKGSFVCELCNKALKSEETLKYHMKRHSNTKNVSCELCGARFVSTTELASHKNRHTNVKRFFCTQCDYSCHWRKSLAIHIRRHLKDKTIQCDECEYTCYTNAELQAHKRKHSKIQNYPCPLCDKKFKQSPSVNKHMLKKHGQKFTWGSVADRRYIK